MPHATYLTTVAAALPATTLYTMDADALNLRLTRERQVDHQFMTMLNAFRANGGLARAQEVFMVYKSNYSGEAATLARWIVKREVISFDWESKIWIPLFQFDRTHMQRLEGLDAVLTVLNPVLSPWELALWFAQPSPWLLGRTPADVLATEPKAVLEAAGADRFIAV